MLQERGLQLGAKSSVVTASATEGRFRWPGAEHPRKNEHA
jgi:hypothetical protein